MFELAEKLASQGLTTRRIRLELEVAGYTLGSTEVELLKWLVSSPRDNSLLYLV